MSNAKQVPPVEGEIAYKAGVEPPTHGPQDDSPSTETDHEELQTELQQADISRARTLKPVSWFFVVFSLLAALFLFALDNTIVADVQPSIIATLGEIEKLPWISVAFALAGISLNLFWYVSCSEIGESITSHCTQEQALRPI